MGRLQDKRLFLLDMDGTIYLDDRLFDGVTAFLSRIREKGGRYLFLTNNSSKGVEGYIEKLNGMGIATGREDYLTSVDAAIDLLRRRYPGRRCYVQGTRSFYDQLAAAGIPVTCGREDGAEILLSGFDRELTFQKLEDACILLNRGVTWLATNPDWVCPTWYGAVPDCGSVCEMLHRATGREPEFIGKPRPAMVQLALEGTGYPPEAAVLLGEIARTLIRRVALDDRAVHMLDHRPPKFRGQEVLVALFAGMQLHGDVPRQFQTTGFVELQHVFGSNIARKINLRCHKNIPPITYLCGCYAS